MDGYERRKHKKMEQIFGVALELFSKYGFQKISVNEIAHQAKVSPATIYNYFGTKEQLFADTLVNWMDKQLAQYERILDSGLSFPEKTKQIMLLEAKNVKMLADEFPKVPSSELGGLMQRVDDHSEQKIAHFFRRFVALGKREGYIHTNQTEEVSMRYFAMFKNELVKYWGASNPESSAQSVDQWVELFFYGMAGQRRQGEEGKMQV